MPNISMTFRLSRTFSNMAGKRQHYVPRFYLRRFAVDKRRRRINVFYIPENRMIHNASLRDQCYGNRFYGQDSLEDWFAMLEDHWATTLAKIVDTCTFPSRDSVRHAHLTTFVCMQHLRTQGRQAEVQQLTDSFAKQLLAEDPRFNQLDLSDFEISVDNPLSMTLGHSLQASISIHDLHFHLLHAPNTNLCTSDDPVIRYNTWCEGAGEGGIIGLVKSGLQIICPLSPSLCLLM